MLLVISVVILVKRYQVSHETNKVIWIANSLLFITSTAHFALMFNHFYIALVRTNKFVMIRLDNNVPAGNCSVRKFCKRNSCADGSKFVDFSG